MIRTEEEYKLTLAHIEKLWDAELGSLIGEELDNLVDEVMEYEQRQSAVKVLFNGVKCPDGVIIHSRHQNHFVAHEGVDSKGAPFYITVDGGLEFETWGTFGGDCSEAQEIILTTEDDHETLRECVDIYSTGKTFDQPEERILIKDMTDDHLESFVEYWEERGHHYPQLVDVCRNEIVYREGFSRG